jgi:hypothetical protein
MIDIDDSPSQDVHIPLIEPLFNMKVNAIHSTN